MRRSSSIVLVLLTLATSTAGSLQAAEEYQCGVGKPSKASKKCECPTGYNEQTDAKSVSRCVPIPKPVETNAPGEPTKPWKKPPRAANIAIPRPVPENSSKVESSLVTEIVALEQQLDKTKVTSDKHVIVARRLAETYYDLEQKKQQEVLELSKKIGESPQSPQAADWKANRTKSEAVRDKCRTRVQELYRMVVDKHDDYVKLDEVLYYLAFEHEQQKATDPTDASQVKRERESREKALATYLELIKKRPKSRYVPFAYLAYGDLYYEDAFDDKIDWRIPLEAYDRVVESGDPPDNKVWGYAQYRKASVYWHLKQYKDALDTLKKAIVFAEKFADLPKSSQIAAESRKMLVPVYAESRGPGEAYAVFKPLFGDAAGEQTKTIEALENLADAYLAKGYPSKAVKLYADLKARNPSKAAAYAARAEAAKKEAP